MRRLVTGSGSDTLAVMRGYGRRVVAMVAEAKPDLIWVYGELFPYVPAWIERALLPAGVPLLLDWDDAFHIPYEQHRRSLIRRLLGRKMPGLLARANAMTCGNEFVRQFARTYCPRAIVVPTVVDTDDYVPAAPSGGAPVIGWIGSPSTWINVRPLLPLLATLHRETGVRIRAVGAGAAAAADRFEGLELVDWREETEIAEVQGFSIGIMPLLDRPFERGKSGFKLIQYMACGLPTVASPVGVNSEIVTPDSGFLARDEAGWRGSLTRLIADPGLRARLGAAGRARAVEHYSLASQAPRLIALFRSLAER